jgi:murein DD-endopeptidase MepM/ murein hydrolase activator NlpD
MGEYKFRRHGIFRAASAIALASLVAACAGGPPNPAPVVLRGNAPRVVAEPAGEPLGAALPRAEERRIVVEPGQSLGGIAHAYHVPAPAIIAANHLTPPYKIEAGRSLVIPGAGAAPLSTPPPLMAASPASPNPHDRPAEIIPLDGPAPAPRAPPEPSAADEARSDPAAAAPLPHGGHFAWPVKGHILVGYGVTAGGKHNDGINIAAPRGTPVTAVDGGTVAYAGNELRGYGNLVLVKHANGWITAYAHCEELLVKQGDTVSRGQEIAKVGATGGVAEPQLHFELRRGKHAVDPREFLAPAPSAGVPESPHPG